MKKKVPNFKLSVVDSIGELILIFGLKLSIGSPYYQGGRIWTNFRLSKCFILRWYSWESCTSLPKHSVQSFCTGLDHPGLPRMIQPNSVFQHWVSPDDPGLGFCEHLKGPGWMIRPYTGWSGPRKFKCVFSLFCHYPGWSEVTPDDPGTTRKHTTVTFGGGSIYTPSQPSFTSLGSH